MSNLLSANPTKSSNTLKQFVGNLPTDCLSVFDHFVGLALKGLNPYLSAGPLKEGIQNFPIFQKDCQILRRQLTSLFLHTPSVSYILYF